MQSFKNWARVLVNAPDKYAIFESFLTFPLETTPLTKKINDALSKVWDGQNPVRSCEFAVPEMETDYEDFRREHEIEEKLKKQTAHVMKHQINAIRIVDLPAEQTTPLPEPYFYLLDIGSVIDYQVFDENFLWVIFRKSDTEIVVIDDGSYRTFKTKERQNEIETITGEAPHDLTYCPASWAWSDSISEDCPDEKMSPFTTWLPAFDNFLFWSIAKKHHELYGSWVIAWAYESKCDFSREDPTLGWLTCDGGKLRSDSGFIQTGQNTFAPCPKCGNRPLAAPGALLKVPIPTDGNASLAPAVGFVEPKVDLFDFRVKENERLEKAIYEGIVGFIEGIPSNQAVNKDQVMAELEKWKANLILLKPNIDRAKEWTEYTVCKLRYADKFDDCSHDSGTEFYLLDAQVTLGIYNDLRKQGADANTLDAIYSDYLMAKYRNDPDELQTQKIRIALDPFRHLSLSDVNNLWMNNIIDEKDYQLKLNFSTFVNRFEREQAPLLIFGANLQFNKKIEKIKSILLSYGRSITKPEPVTGQPAG